MPHSPNCGSRLRFDLWRYRQSHQGDLIMQNNLQDNADEGSELPSLLLGAGFALASLIILPALAQRVGIGASLTIALRGALMRASNRV
jgi:hypothetical protein